MTTLLDLARPALAQQTPEEQLKAALALYHERFVLYPPFLGKLKDLPDLHWTKIEFSPQNRALLPRKQGVYAFAVEFSDIKIPFASHILYIGKAGDINSQNTLWRRYQDYVRTEKMHDRPRIYEMLERWKGHLKYYFAEVDNHLSTAEIEQCLLDIFIPPFNRGDFSPEMKSLLKGANII
jgi:hypothetical protein